MLLKLLEKLVEKMEQGSRDFKFQIKIHVFCRNVNCRI